MTALFEVRETTKYDPQPGDRVIWSPSESEPEPGTIVRKDRQHADGFNVWIVKLDNDPRQREGFDCWDYELVQESTGQRASSNVSQWSFMASFGTNEQAKRVWIEELGKKWSQAVVDFFRRIVA